MTIIDERSTEVTQVDSTSVVWKSLAPGVEINAAALSSRAERLLPSDAIRLLARLHRLLQGERAELLRTRTERQAAWDRGEVPGYLEGEITDAAKGDWKVHPLPEDLRQRRVEITGPINDTKMVINMLSRTETGQRADAAMLDFEDSMKPSWDNVVSGLENLIGAADGSLTFAKSAPNEQPDKVYRLDPDDMALLMVRCRGLHLDESNLKIDGQPVSGGLMDLALSAFHTARALLDRGKTPKYYIPKIEHHLEARWWEQLLTALETELSFPAGTLRATFLIETLPAAFQMEEILYELRQHATGLNVGRWDKIFSDIKVLKAHPDRIMADRASISMNRPWMKNYATRLIRICHRHGAFAMGGMAAFTPGKTPERRAEQTRKVVEDKEFEFSLGHDGCWVSHPYFIGPAMSAFTQSNQLEVMPKAEEQPDLLPISTPPRTLDGLRTNLRVGIAYLQGWNQDIGCVAWDDLMEDLATLEISRAQTWQWLHHEVELDGGACVDRQLVHRIFSEELATILDEVRDVMEGRPESEIDRILSSFTKAQQDAQRIFTEETFRPFLSQASDLAAGLGAGLASDLATDGHVGATPVVALD